MKVQQITLHRLRVPLKVPYKLALAEIRAFDTILVEARDGDGRTGFGEATVLTGYTDETIEQAWRRAGELAGAVAGQPLDVVKKRLDQAVIDTPFTATALTTAIEMLEDTPYLKVSRPVNVPLLALVHGMGAVDLEAEINALLNQGYHVLKIKIGFDVDADLRRVRLIQRLVGDRARLRLDANQGYGRAEACRFAAALDPSNIELLEQTCAAGDWDAARAVAEAATVPVMLDESIYNLQDVDKAAELGAARYIKFKLMKAGGLERLAQALAHIKACGMEPVLGNGVACDVGCWMEACMAPGRIANAGEMNGFLKTYAPLFAQPLALDGGAIRLASDFAPVLDRSVIANCTLASASFGDR